MIERLHPINKNKQAGQLAFYNPNPDAKHYVMWSSGCDSTLLLYELLKKYGPDKVIAISCKFPWLNKKKASHEVVFRQRFIDDLKRKNTGLSGFTHYTIDVNWQYRPKDSKNGSYHSSGLLQPYSWLTIALPLMKPNDWFYIGTIRGDDLVTLYLRQFQDLFEASSKMLNKEIHLCMPYVGYTKANVIAKLIEYGIYDLTWFCEKPESPTSGPCTNCHPCKTHIEALASIATDTTVLKYVQLKAVSELNSLLATHSKKVAAEKQAIKEKAEEITKDVTVVNDSIYMESNVNDKISWDNTIIPTESISNEEATSVLDGVTPVTPI